MIHDPLDIVWLAAAHRLRIRVARDESVFASWNGRDTLSVCPRNAYDPDDSLAQLILHELCHALVQGPKRRHQVDWGLENTTPEASALAEHACHRLQAALTARYGLRHLLAVTTDWRPYWDALPPDPLTPGDDPAIDLARAAWPDAMRGPWARPLHDALRATADLADIVRPHAPADSLWATTTPRTPVGIAARPGDRTCGGCAWFQQGTCAVHEQEVAAAWPACIHEEPPLDDADCRTCGACCREGFHLVAVEPGEPVLTRHPELVVLDQHGAHIPRPGGTCVALSCQAGAFACRVYDDRPQACADFEIAGAHCLDARRRVGLTRS